MKYSVSPSLFMPSASANATRYEPFSAICSDAVITVDDSTLSATAFSGPSTRRPVATGASVWIVTVTRVPSGP